MLDYGYRSKCCLSTIRLGKKKIKNTSLSKKVWICIKCRKSDVDIITYEEARSQTAKLVANYEYLLNDPEDETW